MKKYQRDSENALRRGIEPLKDKIKGDKLKRDKLEKDIRSLEDALRDLVAKNNVLQGKVNAMHTLTLTCKCVYHSFNCVFSLRLEVWSASAMVFWSRTRSTERRRTRRCTSSSSAYTSSWTRSWPTRRSSSTRATHRPHCETRSTCTGLCCRAKATARKCTCTLMSRQKWKYRCTLLCFVS